MITNYLSDMSDVLIKGIGETLFMTIAATLISYLFGLILGIILNITDKNGIWECRVVNIILGVIVNIFRSIPFLILVVFVMPVTKFIVGSRIGTVATIVPLSIGSIPFVARMVESSLKEVPYGLIEASKSMGATKWQIITKVLLPEARASLMVGFAISITTILSYSAMAGFMGGEGLGKIAVDYGYYRSKTSVMFISVILLVVLVQLFQTLGTFISKKIDKRIK